jgi:hypothetical protein
MIRTKAKLINQNMDPIKEITCWKKR